MNVFMCSDTVGGKLHIIIEALKCGVGNISLMSYYQCSTDKWFCNRHTKANVGGQD